MIKSKQDERVARETEAPRNRLAYRLLALAFSTLVIAAVPVAASVYRSDAPGVDFVSFWAAGRLALAGDPVLAYDIAAHRAVEMTVTSLGGLMPFPYPPPFLLVVSAFASLPYWLAYLPWIIVTGALYLGATWARAGPRFALAHPGALVNVVIGQNGFLTGAIFVGGVSLVGTRPLIGGAILGLLVIKPQLALLLPVALAASGNWRAFGAAALSALLFLAVAALAFGPETYRAFLAMAAQQGDFFASREWDWSEQASVFAFLRHFGAGREIALAAQGAVALAAAVLTWRAWSSGHENRGAVLAAASLLVPPYLFIYDSLILVMPIAVLLGHNRRPWLLPLVWLCLLVPLLGYFGTYGGPSTVWIAAALCLWALSSDLGRAS